MVNESEQWEINGNNLELVPLDEVQTVSLPVAIPLQSRPLGFPRGEAGAPQRGVTDEGRRAPKA